MWICKRCGCSDFSCDLENDWIECENCGLHSQNRDDIESIADWTDYLEKQDVGNSGTIINLCDKCLQELKEKIK